jgi:hypothetical protein
MRSTLVALHRFGPSGYSNATSGRRWASGASISRRTEPFCVKPWSAISVLDIAGRLQRGARNLLCRLAQS